MRLAIADERLWDKTWEKHASECYPEDVLAMEQKEQGDIEDAIEEIIGDDFSPGFDWTVQHFDTPSFVFTLTLQNAALIRRPTVDSIITVVTGFGERWKLNLGLVDAIHDGVWDSVQDFASLLGNKDRGIILRHAAYEELDCELRQWFDEITTNGA
ncbi:MAG: hypothetical protein AAF591_00550 [Verrucomicrobiota bacterium]